MEIFFGLFILIFGTAVGSFLNVLIDRLPQEKSIYGRSICDYCYHQLAWYDLIPIVSFLLLSGRCRYCQKKLSFQYPLVELITAVSFLLIYLYLGPFFTNEQFITNFHLRLWQMIGYWVVIASLIVVFFADFKYHIIPDSIQLSFFVGTLILLPFAGNNLLSIFLNRVLAAFLVAAPIYFIYFLSNGRAMGFGDVKLSFTIGFLLGIKSGFMALYLAFVTGGIVGSILLLVGKKKLKSKIAFGPFLVIGILIMLFFGEKLIGKIL
jgi:leader peptidase (prepilin peptidase)/N-methyltransferase